jgi:glycosyltransferase involved in cell wall biosynthesis
VLQFLTNFKIGGTERQVLNLVRCIDPARFELHLACLGRFGEFLREVERRPEPLIEFPINRLYGRDTLRQQAAFVSYLKRHKLQVVHAYGFYPNVFALAAARLARVPVVLASIRDTGDHLSPMRRRVHRLACRLADRVLVNASAVRDRLVREGYDARKIVLIPNGIDTTPFLRRPRREGLRGELGIPEDAPLVAVLSRLNRLKGVEDFLSAAAAIALRFPRARFLLVGDCETCVDAGYRESLEAHAARLGLGERAIFTGFRNDIPELLSEVTVSVLPSLTEGLSNSILEAMAAGVAVVATRVGGNPELVEDGVTGLLVPPRDPRALAGAVCRLLEQEELASRLARAGQGRVLERFSLERMVRQTEALYDSLLESTLGRPARLEWRHA